MMATDARKANSVSLNEIQDEARRDAGGGKFRNPYQQGGWTLGDRALHAAAESYSKAYWEEIDRRRFERGDYDLL
jgi:hypothetical protein